MCGVRQEEHGRSGGADVGGRSGGRKSKPEQRFNCCIVLRGPMTRPVLLAVLVPRRSPSIALVP